jgi:hypothetical protein
MFEPKYIKTEDNQIIIFPAKFQHKEFKHLNPVSAGFVSIGAKGMHDPDIKCYGESTSLGLKSEEIDSELAYRQFINYHY